MFLHHDEVGKCEWLSGNLEAFARHYNAEFGTSYSLGDCLDLVRISGSTRKEPEVLLNDAATGMQMVIERKAVAWPPDYLHRHQLEHDFANIIWARMPQVFRDGLYSLTVHSVEFDKLDSKMIRKVGEEIAGVVVSLSPADLPLRRQLPVRWTFAQADTTYHGEKKGIVVEHEGEGMMFGSAMGDKAEAGTALAIEEQICAAALKFTAYSTARKVVLLDFYGDDLSEDDIPALIKTESIPVEIDEVWRTIRVWTSAEGYEVGYDRLFTR